MAATELAPQQQAAVERAICILEDDAAQTASNLVLDMLDDYGDSIEDCRAAIDALPPGESRSMLEVQLATIRDGVHGLTEEFYSIVEGVQAQSYARHVEADHLYAQGQWTAAAVRYTVAYEGYRLATGSYQELAREIVIRGALQGLRAALGI